MERKRKKKTDWTVPRALMPKSWMSVMPPRMDLIKWVGPRRRLEEVVFGHWVIILLFTRGLEICGILSIVQGFFLDVSTWSRVFPFNFHFKVVFCVGSDPTLVQGWVRMGSVRVDSLLSHESLKTWNGQSGPFHVWGFALYHSLYYTESQDWLRLLVGTDIKAMSKSQTIDN